MAWFDLLWYSFGCFLLLVSFSLITLSLILLEFEQSNRTLNGGSNTEIVFSSNQNIIYAFALILMFLGFICLSYK